MSRRPKTFLVLLLVSMFLMTQVAMAGAATVSWNSMSTLYTNSTVAGTIYGTAYGQAYAFVYDTVYGTTSQLSTPAFTTTQYIYGGKAFSFYMSSFSGLTLNRTYQVGLKVYEASTEAGVASATPTTETNPTTYTLYQGTSTDSSGGGGGGSTTTTTPNTTVTPTVTTSGSAAVTAASGGTVSIAGAAVAIPAGILSGNGTVSITPVTDLASTPVATTMTLGSTVVDIVLSGATLTGTVDITLNYDTKALANVPAEQIAVFYWNPARAGWIYCGGKVDTATGKVTVGVNHFTKFAVMANKNLKVPADITGNWAFDSIKRLLGMGVVTGYTDGSFKPGNNITRAEFAKIMVDAMGWKPAAAPSLKFADAAQIGDWAKGYVATAVEKGLIAGYSDNTFKPANQITRAEIATIVVKALGKTAAGAPEFSDAKSIPAWAQGYVAVAVKEGIVAGYSDKTFKAGNNATRAEAAKMAANLLTSLKI